MGTKDHREIERKFLIKEPNTYARMERVMLDHYEKDVSPSKILTADTWDDYWEVPGKAQFVRVRYSIGRTIDQESQSLKEITVKHKDRGNNLNRLELNIKIDSVETAREAYRLTLGAPIGRIRKEETVVFCPDGVVTSLCRINREETFIEVEGPTEGLVKKHIKALEGRYEWSPEKRNLFEIYIIDSNSVKH